MAESKGPIASAVILPTEAPVSPRAKRRQSSSSETAAKRARLSISDGAGSPTTLTAPRETKPEPSAERRTSSVVEERKRGQRLFGGLLSTLSQSTSNGQQKRRQEIEKRQQEKAKQQKVEDEGRKAEKLAKLKTIRKSEQIKFEEQSMRIRHSNMLAMAHFLCTKAEPKLYYKPWEMLPGDEERIKAQIDEAEATIAREVDDFRNRHPKIEEASATDEQMRESASQEAVGEPHTESASVSQEVVNPATTTTTDAQVSASAEEARNEAFELHNGEVVVEAEEDTVIY
ncbi:hypothetical protein BP6252_12550 [Coleophoma cylindrospora]|uniref:Pinin/SDK/MemA protein domain-containing protein n=1 Tax=Coleophoma cylindrospora TaxID=1849047 RepID=A0A3D8QC84_9HELO|nr:hypothetical protein BP6252_12550 [Coleophoma cylindrospora]